MLVICSTEFKLGVRRQADMGCRFKAIKKKQEGKIQQVFPLSLLCLPFDLLSWKGRHFKQKAFCAAVMYIDGNLMPLGYLHGTSILAFYFCLCCVCTHASAGILKVNLHFLGRPVQLQREAVYRFSNLLAGCLSMCGLVDLESGYISCVICRTKQ